MAVQGIQKFTTTAEIPSYPNAMGIGLIGNAAYGKLPDGTLVPLGAIGFGANWYVDTVDGDDTQNSGQAPDAAFATVQAAFDAMSSGDTIWVVGDVREELIAPLGVYNARIIGGIATRPHHDLATRWREAASHTAVTPLLQLREQGWTVANILFVPPSDAPAIRLKRAEDAVYPDASHCTIAGNRFAGGLTAIEDDGGCHNQLIAGNIFQSQTDSAYECISTSIAVPLQNNIVGNQFISCVHGIRASQSKSTIRGNTFIEITTTKVSTTHNAGQGDLNFVIENFFPSTQANISIAGGYAGGAADVWRNYSTDTAAQTVGVPA